jgi:pyrroline-5-carboxylate reductase
MQAAFSIGIIGGSGMLGRAIALALLRSGWPETRLWIANRSGSRAGFEDHPGVTLTADNQALTDACDLVLLSVPPALAVIWASTRPTGWSSRSWPGSLPRALPN